MDTENTRQGGFGLVVLFLSVYFCANMHSTLICKNTHIADDILTYRIFIFERFSIFWNLKFFILTA